MNNDELIELCKTVKTMARRQTINSLLYMYKLLGYAVKKNSAETILENPEKTGWYIKLHENKLDIYEDGLLKRRIGSDYECIKSYWPNGELHTEVWKDLTTSLTEVCKRYTAKGELSESVLYKRDSSGDIVREYAQTFWHTERKVDEKNGILIKTTEFLNDLIDKNKSVYKVTMLNENSTVLYENVKTADGDVYVTYGEHEKRGNVLMRVENCDFCIGLIYDEEGICILNVTDKRFVGNPKTLIYLKETCLNRELMTDWEKAIEFVKKKKYRRIELKRHWYDFKDNKFVAKIDKIQKRSMTVESVDLDNVEFVKGTIVRV